MSASLSPARSPSGGVAPPTREADKGHADRRTQMLLEAPLVPSLLRLAAPNVIVMVSQASVGLIETYFVGKLGTDALAGMALVFPITLSHRHLDGGEIELLIAPKFSLVEGHPCEPLFEDTFSCLVWRGHRFAPEGMTAEHYFESGHVGVEWSGGRRVTFDAQLLLTGKRQRRQEVIAPNFTLVPQLLVGTDRIATLPTRLARAMANELDVVVVPCPLPIPPSRKCFSGTSTMSGILDSSGSGPS